MPPNICFPPSFSIAHNKHKKSPFAVMEQADIPISTLYIYIYICSQITLGSRNNLIIVSQTSWGSKS